MENFDKYALKSGTILHGNVHEYVITDLLAGDSQGFTYRVRTVPPEGRQIRKSKLAEELVIREHFMTLCSERADDGLTVVTPEDIGPTVDDCLDLFTTSSNERARVSKGHKSIIDVIECFAANGTYYYVVDYLNGETLEEYVRQRGPLSIRSAIRLLSPIFEATDHIHRFHSLHTDITPRHIRFTSDTPGAQKDPFCSASTTVSISVMTAASPGLFPSRRAPQVMPLPNNMTISNSSLRRLMSTDSPQHSSSASPAIGSPTRGSLTRRLCAICSRRLSPKIMSRPSCTL